jgi:hypothetical protein
VRFEVVPPTLWCAHCHCEDCRRAHGAAFVTWAGVAVERFRLLAGEEQLRRYQATPAATRTFCGECGTPLFFQGDRWPGEIHVAVPAFTAPLDRPPAAHAYFDRRVPWLELGDSLPRFGGDSGTEPL